MPKHSDLYPIGYDRLITCVRYIQKDARLGLFGIILYAYNIIMYNLRSKVGAITYFFFIGLLVKKKKSVRIFVIFRAIFRYIFI